MKMPMCLPAVLVGCVFWFSLLVDTQTFAEEKTGEWIPLFNGKNLDGWTLKIKGFEVGDNHAETFRVEDGVIKAVYDQYEGRFRGRFGHLFYNETFSNYDLRVEYRFVGEQAVGAPGWAIRNSGIMIHGQSPQSMALKQDFPASIEVQLLGGDGAKKRSTANLCTPATHVVMDGKLHTPHCTSSSSKTYHGDQWVTVEVEVRGNQVIRHKIDGQTILEYTEPQLDESDDSAKALLDAGADKMLSGGTISLQSEGHPVEFRKVELRKVAN